VSEYLSEEEQVEALKKWWKENGRSVIAGVVIGLGAVFGWQAWSQHQQQIAEQASHRFAQMQFAMEGGNYDAVEKQAELLASEHADSSYTLFAALYKAKIKQERGDSAGAQEELEWVLANTDEPGLQQIARLRLVRVLLEINDTDKAASVLAQAENDSFAGEFAALRGDLANIQGDSEAAREAYQEALQRGVTDSGMVLMKLDDLTAVTETP
jgi:predicted negative regulator of RcsB-dependent stress response